MADPAPASTPAPAPAPWHAGVEPEILGHWQNRNIPLDDPKAVAIAMTNAHRGAEKLIGVPQDQLIRLPTDVKDEAGWKSVWARLGAPAEAKDYDFSTVKNAAGQAIDAKLADTIRAAAATAHLPKDAATAVAASIVKHMDGMNAEQSATATAKLAEQKAALKANWGDNFDFNHLKAMEGARRLGIAPEAVAALENQIGYAAVMDAMRKIGSLSGEDPFVEGTAKGAMTQEGAAARKAELLRDVEWSKRLLSGDPAAKREWDALERLITGITEIAA